MLKPQIQWTNEKKDYLRENYPNGDLNNITNYLQISRKALQMAARRFNVIRDSKLKYLEKIKPLTENTPFVWYWLGFIMADGNINDNAYLRISLVDTDKEHLKILADFLNVKLCKYKGTMYGKYKSKDGYLIRVRDIINCPKIKDMFEITGPKTYNACSLKCLNEKDKLLPFFAGFIDGDGCITQNKMSGNANMLRIQCHKSWMLNLEFLASEVERYLDIQIKVYLDTQGYVKLTLNKNKELKKLKNELLTYKIPLMKRKWDKI